MANSADPDQLASSEANWSGSTLFAKQGISRFSRTRVSMALQFIYLLIYLCACLDGSVGCAADWWLESRGFDPRRVWHHSFRVIMKYFSMFIQEGELSASGERMCTNTAYPLRGLILLRKSVVRETDRLHMTLMGWLRRKTLTQKICTVDSRYLEFQGTLWNTSRYPYFDISDLQNWGKN